MNPDVILLGCFLVAVAALWLLSRIDRRNKNAFILYGQSLENIQVIERQKLEELKTIRLYEGQRLIETRKISANMPQRKNEGRYKHTGPR